MSSLSNEYSDIGMYIAVRRPWVRHPPGQHSCTLPCAHQQPGRPRDIEPFQVCQLCPPRGRCSQRQACSLRGASHACKQDPHQCCRCHAPPLGVDHLHRHLHRDLAQSVETTVLAASWCLCCCRMPGTLGQSHAADQTPGYKAGLTQCVSASCWPIMARLVQPSRQRAEASLLVPLKPESSKP